MITPPLLSKVRHRAIDNASKSSGC